MSGSLAALRARRLLALLHLMRRDSTLSLEAVATMLGSSPIEIAEDLDTLACCGLAPYTADVLVPVFVDEGVIEVFGELPALSQRIRLSASEARAMATALQAAGMDADDPLAVKLFAASAPLGVDAADMERVVRAHAAPGTGEALRAIATGLREHRAIEIEYRTAGTDAEMSRTIEPLAMRAERGAWYVEAFCRYAGALRTFRADRMRSARVTGEVFEAREHSPSGVAIDTDRLPRARLRFAPGEEFSERDWPGARLADTSEDGAIEIDVPYAGTAWIARRVAARLGGVEVVAPEPVRIAVARLAADLLGN